MMSTHVVRIQECEFVSLPKAANTYGVSDGPYIMLLVQNQMRHHQQNDLAYMVSFAIWFTDIAQKTCV